MKKREPATVAEVDKEIDDVNLALTTAIQEGTKAIQFKYRLAVLKAREARKVEMKSGNLVHVIRALFWEWQERHYRRVFLERKRLLLLFKKQSKDEPPGGHKKHFRPRVRETETLPNGTLS